jgi:hypothetical protein
MRSGVAMQKRLQEETARMLVEQLGYSRYENGELRPPPKTEEEAAEQALVETAEARMVEGNLTSTEKKLLEAFKDLINNHRLAGS